jgi:hypothetical protein
VIILVSSLFGTCGPEWRKSTRLLFARRLSNKLQAYHTSSWLAEIPQEPPGDENRYSELTKDLPLGRAANPREIGDMAAFLAPDRSACTSG